MSTTRLKKKKNHLWYLSVELIALAFFDYNIPIDVKGDMIKSTLLLLQHKRSLPGIDILLHHQLSDFVSRDTNKFFISFGLSCEFLHHDPSTWQINIDFLIRHAFCKNLFVVYDPAERAVQFMQSYYRALTSDDEQQEMILQIVEAYSNKYPSCNKSCLI